MFRDEYADLSATGFTIYGLSKDSPKANTTFKVKQKLTYTLLCDPSLNLIPAIGLKKGPNGTARGVFVVDKSGKVLLAETGSPDGTVQVCKIFTFLFCGCHNLVGFEDLGFSVVA